MAVKDSAPPKSAKPRYVWLFDPEQMVLGDIVLERGSGPSSTFVAGATLGRYSHALIWVGTDFIEAMPGGVRTISFARVPVIERDNWSILRPRNEFARLATAAVVEARNMAFKDYDTEGALRTVIGGRNRATPSKRFCSQLIVEASLRAGVDLLPGKRPEQVTPNMLLRSPCLEKIELPLRRPEELELGPYPEKFLDRSTAYLDSSMRQQLNIDQAITKAVATRIRSLAIPRTFQGSRPGNLNELLAYIPHLPPGTGRSFATEVLELMEGYGYFDLLRPQLSSIMARVNGDARWELQVPGWVMSRDRHSGNASALVSYLMQMPHPLWSRLRSMHLEYAHGFQLLIDRAEGKPPGL